MGPEKWLTTNKGEKDFPILLPVSCFKQYYQLPLFFSYTLYILLPSPSIITVNLKSVRLFSPRCIVLHFLLLFFLSLFHCQSVRTFSPKQQTKLLESVIKPVMPVKSELEELTKLSFALFCTVVISGAKNHSSNTFLLKLMHFLKMMLSS